MSSSVDLGTTMFIGIMYPTTITTEREKKAGNFPIQIQRKKYCREHGCLAYLGGTESERARQGGTEKGQDKEEMREKRQDRCRTEFRKSYVWPASSVPHFTVDLLITYAGTRYKTYVERIT